MDWHRTLSTYGIIHGDDQHEDTDIELLNKVVEKVLIKKIQKLLDVWNPISSKETRYAIQAIEQISYYVEKHERTYQVKKERKRKKEKEENKKLKMTNIYY